MPLAQCLERLQCRILRVAADIVIQPRLSLPRIIRQEQNIGIDGEDDFFRHLLPVAQSIGRNAIDNARMVTGIIKAGSNAPIRAHEGEKDDALALAFRNGLHLLRDLGQFFIHFAQ